MTGARGVALLYAERQPGSARHTGHGESRLRSLVVLRYEVSLPVLSDALAAHCGVKAALEKGAVGGDDVEARRVVGAEGANGARRCAL